MSDNGVERLLRIVFDLQEKWMTPKSDDTIAKDTGFSSRF